MFLFYFLPFHYFCVPLFLFLVISFVQVCLHVYIFPLVLIAITSYLFLPPPGETRVFGAHLIDAVARSAVDGDMVPLIVRRSIEYIEAKGLKETGVYRLSGSLAQVRDFKAMWDRGVDPDYMSNCSDAHVVAGLFKQYLRELPDKLAPNLTADENDLELLKQVLRKNMNHEYGIDIVSIFQFNVRWKNESININVQQELSVIPIENYALLEALARHFHNVQAYSSLSLNEQTAFFLLLSKIPKFVPLYRSDSFFFLLIHSSTPNQVCRRELDARVQHCNLLVPDDLPQEHNVQGNGHVPGPGFHLGLRPKNTIHYFSQERNRFFLFYFFLFLSFFLLCTLVNIFVIPYQGGIHK